MALAFSVLKQLPIRVFSIRAGRSNPGLRAQHLKGNFYIMLIKFCKINLLHQTLCLGLLERNFCYSLHKCNRIRFMLDCVHVLCHCSSVSKEHIQ